MYSCTGVRFWRKFSLNNCVFLRNKVIRGNFEAIKCLPLGFKGLMTNGDPNYHSDSFLHMKLQKFDDMFNSQIWLGTRNPVFDWSETMIIWKAGSSHIGESVNAPHRIDSSRVWISEVLQTPTHLFIYLFILHKIPVRLRHTAGFELSEAEILPL